MPLRKKKKEVYEKSFFHWITLLSCNMKESCDFQLAPSFGDVADYLTTQKHFSTSSLKEFCSQRIFSLCENSRASLPKTPSVLLLSSCSSGGLPPYRTAATTALSVVASSQMLVTAVLVYIVLKRVPCRNKVVFHIMLEHTSFSPIVSSIALHRRSVSEDPHREQPVF